MKKEEVRDLTRQFVAALEEEKQLRQKLLDLRMQGPEEEVRRNLAKHDAMIEEIGRLREEKMLPVIEKLAAFIAERTGKNTSPQERLRQAISEGKRKVAEKRLHPEMEAARQRLGGSEKGPSGGRRRKKRRTKAEDEAK